MAVLDSPGEFVCVQAGNVSTVSFVPPPQNYPIIPVMAKLEKVLTVGNVDNVNIEGLSFQHTNHYGLDRGMDFQHAAVTVSNSMSKVSFYNTLVLISCVRCQHQQLRVHPHWHDGTFCFSQL